jgi:hypothetical protein
MLLEKYQVRCVRLGDQMGGGREDISHRARRGRMEYMSVQRRPRGHWGGPCGIHDSNRGVRPLYGRHGSGTVCITTMGGGGPR